MYVTVGGTKARQSRLGWAGLGGRYTTTNTTSATVGVGPTEWPLQQAR